jgi:hypothetical protein
MDTVIKIAVMPRKPPALPPDLVHALSREVVNEP